MDAWVVSFSLILARVGAFVAAQPLFGGRQVPRLVKVGLACALATFWISELTPAAQSDDLQFSAATPWLGYSLAVVRESLIGGVLGYGLGIILLPARIAGEFAGQELGLALASVSDPTADNPATLVGQLFEVFGIAIFLGLNAHHICLAALDGTFARWPIGGAMPSLPVAPLVGGLAQAHEWGLLLAAPLAVCMFVSSVLLALMARAAPQLNLMSVGFAMRLGVGFIAIIAFLPDLLAGMSGVFSHFAEFLARLV
jgi:flagellar biosynthetic protein FliR